MSGNSDAFAVFVIAFCLLAVALAGFAIGSHRIFWWHKQTIVSLQDFADGPQTVVMSLTSAWEKGKGLLILGPEYEIRIFDRRTGREAFK